jgi:hypothetical protein
MSIKRTHTRWVHEPNQLGTSHKAKTNERIRGVGFDSNESNTHGKEHMVFPNRDILQ